MKTKSPKNRSKPDISNKSKQKQNSKTSAQFYAKYSSLAFQMIIIILAGTFGGIQLDKAVALKFPIFTLIFTLLSVALALYFAIKDLLK